MLSFDLRRECNKVLSELNGSLLKKNIINLGVDIQLPERFNGNPPEFIELIKQMLIYLDPILVNGIISIEIKMKSNINSLFILHVIISGKGVRQPVFDLENQIQHIANNRSIKIRHKIDPESILLELDCSIESIPTDNFKVEHPFNHKRILLAEDNEINVMVFTSFLEEWGCENTVAINGDEAVSLCQENEFDAVLMDIFMPILNGNQATRKIREFNSTIPIIALTASSNGEDILEAQESGVNDYLLKPVSSNQLFKALSKYL